MGLSIVSEVCPPVGLGPKLMVELLIYYNSFCVAFSGGAVKGELDASEFVTSALAQKSTLYLSLNTKS